MKEILIENEVQFDEIIKEGVCLVDFYANWCGPCKMLAPFVEEIAEEYDGKIKVCKVDVDNVESLAYRYAVRSIPTLLYFKNGELINTNVGFQSKNDIVGIIDGLLKE
jgi:thioredoxin 1